MARNSTLLAAKYIPGGARPTAAPQNAGAPYYGMLSPLAMQLANERGYSNTYGPFLPRPAPTFTEGAFGPFSPILPVPVDAPAVEDGQPDPRLWEYPVGWNLPVGRPGTEGLKLADFSTLKTIADTYCLAPETRVLCSDLAWRPLSEIGIGDGLVGFDEFPESPKKNRKFRMTHVTSCDRIVRPCYRIRFEDGREVVASAEHRWLAGRARGGNGIRVCAECNGEFKSPAGLGAHRRTVHGTQDTGKQGRERDWVLTAELLPGFRVKDLGAPWETDDSHDAGYLGGLLDGEGSLSSEKAAGSGYFVSFSQRPGTVMDAAERLIKERGYRYNRISQGSNGVENVQTRGLYNSIRLLGEIRPLRLLEEVPRWLEGRAAFPHAGKRSEQEPSRGLLVESVEFLGDREVIAIGTGTRTFFAEGLFSHNSVARSCIQRRKSEIIGLDWDIVPTHEASKAYQGDRKAMRDFGERVAKAKRFFRQPDPDYFTFADFLSAALEEIFVYDALAIVMRPTWGKGMGKGLLGSDLDCLELISGPTIRPLVGMHGEVPRPPAPAYQQYLYGVPRSDYMTMITQRDIDEGGLAGNETQTFRTDQLLYLRTTPRRGTPYGFSATEMAILPILTGLQKQAYQYDYYREGTVPAVYISPGDANITPNQIRELQDALNAIAGDPAWHHKIIVLPPGSKTEPQRPAELADQFDEIVMAEVAMVYDVDPMSLGIIPKVSTVASPFAAREMAQASRTVHDRTSTKPLLKFLADIFNSILHRVCGQDDMKFTFEGLSETQNEAATSDLIVKQVQYGLRSVDEGRAELELPPWNLPETSGPVVFTQMGPIPLDMAPQLLMQQQQRAGGGNSSGSGGKTRATSTTGRGDQYGGPGVPRHGRQMPADSPATTRLSSDVPPERRRGTPGHASAEGEMSIGSSKPGGNGRAVKAELEALGRHLRKGRDIRTWQVKNIPGAMFETVVEDIEKGISIDQAIAGLPMVAYEWVTEPDLPKAGDSRAEWPGWRHDLGLVGAYVEIVRKMFAEGAEAADEMRKDWAGGVVSWTPAMYRDAMQTGLEETIAKTLTPLWTDAWKLGWTSAGELIGAEDGGGWEEGLEAFLATEGRHWTEVIRRTGLKDAARRAEMIARTEVQRAMMAAALQRYRECGIAYKHSVTAPGDLDAECADAAADGVIPLDAAFDCGEVTPPYHVNCRCAIAPAGVNVMPPQGHIGKLGGGGGGGEGGAGESEVVAFLLLRALNRDDKKRYLLQKRADDAHHGGTWGLPGGTAHAGEKPFDAAVREATEEAGKLPELTVRGVMQDADADGAVVRHVYVCDCAWFEPGGGTTPEESAGWGWFSRKEIGKLPLQPNFKVMWGYFTGEILDKTGKKKRILVSGQEIYDADSEENENWPPGGGGGMYPHPHDVQGRDTVVAPGGKPGSEPPRWDGDEAERRMWTAPPNGPGGAAGRTADSPAGGGSAGGYSDGSELRGIPLEGGVPEDEDDAVQPFRRGRPPNAVGKGADDVSDPNPVEARHVHNIMLNNFPAEVLGWVLRTHWIGPVEIPWERIDDDDEDKWAASHQPGAVERFRKRIKAGEETRPSIVVQKETDGRAVIIDGHHRALARRKLGRGILAYVGFVHEKDYKEALETHSSQIHQGSAAENR
jgi:8-oxo-dGTP pyrophosphatase MutT (NUDIX family)